MTNTQSIALLALIILALAIIWISYWMGRREGQENRATDIETDLQVMDLSESLAKANRELFSVRLDCATKIEDLRQEVAKHKQTQTLSLKVETSDLRTLYRLAAILTLAADTFEGLRAKLKAAEARKAAQDCLALAATLKMQAPQAAAMERAA
jgi:cbb3-type cytochrome oxidase subunit 3